MSYRCAEPSYYGPRRAMCTLYVYLLEAVLHTTAKCPRVCTKEFERDKLVFEADFRSEKAERAVATRISHALDAKDVKVHVHADI
jgi:hypothetical protein